MATRMRAQPVVNDVDGIAGGRCVATERVASWVWARIVVNASTLSWVCFGTTQTRTGSGGRNVAFRSSTTRTMLALTARAAMRLLARVVVNDVDVFAHTAITMASERWNLAWLALGELASRALDRDWLGWRQRTWGVPTSTISASALSVRLGWRATGHHQQRPAELALANVRNAWARRRRWSLATVHAVESSRTAVDSPDAGRAEGGMTSAKLLLRALCTRTRTRRPAFHPATAITRFRNDLRTH